MIVVSTGCPAGVGPEVSVRGAAKLRNGRGRARRRRAHAARRGGPRRRRAEAARAARGAPQAPSRSASLPRRDRRSPLGDRRAGKPIEDGRRGSTRLRRRRVPAREGDRSGARERPGQQGRHRLLAARKGAARFRGHTEWLRDRDRAPYAIMCFAAPELVTSLVTTHLPLSRRASRAHPRRRQGFDRRAGAAAPGPRQEEAARRGGVAQPARWRKRALLGKEETTAILPGVRLAEAVLGRWRPSRRRRSAPKPRTAWPTRAITTASSRCTTTRRPSR